MVSRRQVVTAATVLAAAAVTGSHRAEAQGSDGLTVDMVEQAWAFREYDEREIGISSDQLNFQAALSKRFSSDKIISGQAIALVERFEVSSEQVYTARYESPVWPKGQSGLTIGVGYDLGYTTAVALAEDWASLLSPETIRTLASACGKKNGDAESLVIFYVDVKIGWHAATVQLSRYMKLVAGQVIHAFPGSEELSADSFGALASLVYNRGSSMAADPHDPLDRRREMRAIRDAIGNGQLTKVPDQIRLMKRLWEKDTNAKGLLIRRDDEADLFATGLKN